MPGLHCHGGRGRLRLASDPLRPIGSPAMPLRTACPITPSAAERARLKTMAYGHKTEHRPRVRAQVVLHAARGRSNARIAQEMRPLSGNSRHRAVSLAVSFSSVHAGTWPRHCTSETQLETDTTAAGQPGGDLQSVHRKDASREEGRPVAQTLNASERHRTAHHQASHAGSERHRDQH